MTPSVNLLIVASSWEGNGSAKWVGRTRSHRPRRQRVLARDRLTNCVPWSIKNASFDLGDLSDRQPPAELVAAPAQVFRGRLGGRIAAGFTRREVDAVGQGAEPVVGAAAQ